MSYITLEPGTLTLDQIDKYLNSKLKLSLVAEKKIKTSYNYVREIIQKGEVVYGVNTGFGKLAHKLIDLNDLTTLQHNLILSHAVGVGSALPNEIVALILLLKINSLAAGYSGVSLNLINHLIILYNQRAYPKIPAKGSVGASGDLAPLAHLSCTLLGVGQCWYQDRWQESSEVLKQLKCSALTLEPKEGLALINGTQVSTAIAVSALLKTHILFETAIVAGALSVDAALGSDTPFYDVIHEVRGQPGQRQVAAKLLELLEGSEIRKSHLDKCNKIQDPYSLRCQPQVMGAILDQLQYCAKILERECNGITDNPLVFAKTKQILSGGNFHAEYIAFAADALAIAIAEIGSLSERRIALLIDANISNLPPFLISEPGLNSGFMIAQVTAAALVAENKALCFPNSVDSIPTSANQEDHVSMSTHAAWRLHNMIENLAGILAIELLAACQGLDFRTPLKSSKALINYHTCLRKEIEFLEKDRWLAPDVDKIKEMIFKEKFILNQRSFWDF